METEPSGRWRRRDSSDRLARSSLQLARSKLLDVRWAASVLIMLTLGGASDCEQAVSAEGLTVDQIVAEFRSAKGWEAIARDHHADLKKLTTEIQASQDAVEQRTEDKAPRTDNDRTGPAPTDRAGGAGASRGCVRDRDCDSGDTSSLTASRS